MSNRERAIIWDGVHLGLCSFRMVPILDGVHLGLCSFRMVPILDRVHSGQRPFEIVSFRNGVVVVGVVAYSNMFLLSFEMFSLDFTKIVFCKFPDLLLFRFSKQPISLFSPDAEIDLMEGRNMIQ